MSSDATKIEGEIRVQGPHSLRDMLAAAALTGILARHAAPHDGKGKSRLGRDCYDIADELLKERRK